MRVFLEAIAFNHDSNYATSDALNIRRNETEFVTVPEWRRGVTLKPEDSPAAYSIADTRGQTITIKAQIKCTNTTISELFVRAINAYPSTTNILGDVREKLITLNQENESELELFELVEPQLCQSGITVSNIEWRWQFRLSQQDDWMDFAVTAHRIYTLLHEPKDPWNQQPCTTGNILLPWTEVLEHACKWASQAHNDSEAARRITQRTYDLGLQIVTRAGDPSYAFASFNCTALLQLLNGGAGNGQTFNCDDCATIVSTFANAVGCDLSQSGMGIGFDTNRVLLLGRNAWATTGFSRHAVAWRGACEANDQLFDALLKVDIDGTPAAEPEISFLPTDMKFGVAGETNYHFCLVDQASICNPKPDLERQRRTLGNGFLADKEQTNTELLNFVNNRYAFDQWRPDPEVDLDQPVHNDANPDLLLTVASSLEQDSILPDWKLYSLQVRHDVERFALIVDALFRPSSQAEQVFLGIKLYQCKPATNSRRFLRELLSNFQTTDLTREFIGLPFGEVAFVNPDETAALFVRQNIVTLVRSAGRHNVPATGVARALDAFLLNLLQ